MPYIPSGLTAVREYVLTLLVTAAVAYLLTPLVRRLAIAGGFLHEARDRDVHVVPIPRLGGLAIYGGVVAGLVVAGELSPLRTVLVGNKTAAGLLLAGGLIVAVGVIDDRWGLGPLSKLAGQAGAGGILVWSGANLSWLPEPNSGTLVLSPNQSTALTIFLVVATINAVNFIDGLDGLAAGIVCIGAIAFFVYYYRLAQLYHLPEQATPALASALLAGGCLGFLPHNFYPARIFMGDTGSMLLGLLLAYVPISSIASLDYASLHPAFNRFPEVLPLLLPATLLVIPYTDMLLAVVRRTRAGKSPLAPDRKHLHHRLLDIGHSHRSSVLIMYLWAALFSGAIVWLSVSRTPLFLLAVTTLAAVLILLTMSMPRLRWWERKRRVGLAPARGTLSGAAASGAPVSGAGAGRAAAEAPAARPVPYPAAAGAAPLAAPVSQNGTSPEVAPQNGAAQNGAAQNGAAWNGTAQQADTNPADGTPAAPAAVGARVRRPADGAPPEPEQHPGPLARPEYPASGKFHDQGGWPAHAVRE
jgi:UDP-GlcNAc:undecaprenyl-phosphate GlcNAc-1-phosphate transferase